MRTGESKVISSVTKMAEMVGEKAQVIHRSSADSPPISCYAYGGYEVCRKSLKSAKQIEAKHDEGYASQNIRVSARRGSGNSNQSLSPRIASTTGKFHMHMIWFVPNDIPITAIHFTEQHSKI